MNAQYPPLPTVREVMTHPVVSIDPDLRIDIAIELMRSNDVRRLPVLSKTNRLVGIITLAQALIAEAGNSGPSAMLPLVREVMTDYVYTIGPDESIGEAANMMVSHEISSLPVMVGNEMTGIVTESDLFKFLATWLHPDELEGA